MSLLNVFRALFFTLGFAVVNLAAAEITDRPSDIEYAFAHHQQNAQLYAFGTIEKVLADDRQGSRHQKFLVRVNGNLTILIAHNIDIAKRIPELKPGDEIQFYGEYEWNPKGGVVHWTHRDPSGRHRAGWLKYKGITYQ